MCADDDVSAGTPNSTCRIARMGRHRSILRKKESSGRAYGARRGRGDARPRSTKESHPSAVPGLRKSPRDDFARCESRHAGVSPVRRVQRRVACRRRRGARPTKKHRVPPYSRTRCGQAMGLVCPGSIYIVDESSLGWVEIAEPRPECFPTTPAATVSARSRLEHCRSRVGMEHAVQTARQDVHFVRPVSIYTVNEPSPRRI